VILGPATAAVFEVLDARARATNDEQRAKNKEQRDMKQSARRPISKRHYPGLVACILLASVACASASDADQPSDPPASAPTIPPTAPNATTPASAPGGFTDEAINAFSAALGMTAGQLRDACGPAFETCATTPGCDEILGCAAMHGCAGAECYCADARCAAPGPCRAVIDGAPGARMPDAADPSLGAAPAAAGVVGACLVGLAGGGAAPGLPGDP
jgi:hypothetical protein